MPEHFLRVPDEACAYFVTFYEPSIRLNLLCRLKVSLFQPQNTPDQV